MRTTVTIDPDLAAKLKQIARERSLPFKVVLNNALRAGLTKPLASKNEYRMPSRAMGVRPGIDLDKALRLAAELEEAGILHKIDLRK
ncbi:MAG: hypothetical protein ACT4OM_11875 [Actinomycetota bacterium]